MKCRDCPRFDPEANKCADGKVNPPTRSLAVDVANVLGVRAICSFNPYRELLASRVAAQGKTVRKKEQA